MNHSLRLCSSHNTGLTGGAVTHGHTCVPDLSGCVHPPIRESSTALAQHSLKVLAVAYSIRPSHLRTTECMCGGQWVRLVSSLVLNSCHGIFVHNFHFQLLGEGGAHGAEIGMCCVMNLIRQRSNLWDACAYVNLRQLMVQ